MTRVFEFKTHRTRIPWTDGDCLEDTQAAGGTNGHVSAQSLNIQKEFAAKVTDKSFYPKSLHGMHQSFRKKDQKVGCE